jgi:hypothetical protein
MQDSTQDIERFVASFAIGIGLAAASAAFLVAGLVTRVVHGAPKDGLREAFDDAVALDSQDTLADALRESEALLARGGYEDDSNCINCGANYTASPLSRLNSEGLCIVCDAETAGPATIAEYQRTLAKARGGRHSLDPRTHCCTLCGKGPFNKPEVPQTCTNPDGLCFICDSEGPCECPGRRRVEPVQESNCTHPKCVPPNGFDEEAAKKVDAHEVRQLWPRFYGDCPDCGQGVIGYASKMHYYMGDW